MRTLAKDWDRHVANAEEVARQPGFQELRDAILELAKPGSSHAVLDVGAGTGLLTLALADRVSRVWAIDISPAMCDYLSAKAASGGHENVETVVASAISIPLVDDCADVIVSNYCFHHLSHKDKRRALREVWRVLRPGGRLVVADMMFRATLAGKRDRRVVARKVRAMLRRGIPGYLRLAKNGARFLVGAWETPAGPEWWINALRDAGFVDVSVDELPHEGGIAVAVKPS